MVQRMWAEAAGPAGAAEPLFPGSRRSRSVWDAVRLEVGGPDSCPVVLHSFTQLDPDLPRLEVGEPDREGNRAPRAEPTGGEAGVGAAAQTVQTFGDRSRHFVPPCICPGARPHRA